METTLGINQTEKCVERMRHFATDVKTCLKPPHCKDIMSTILANARACNIPYGVDVAQLDKSLRDYCSFREYATRNRLRGEFDTNARIDVPFLLRSLIQPNCIACWGCPRIFNGTVHGPTHVLLKEMAIKGPFLG